MLDKIFSKGQKENSGSLILKNVNLIDAVQSELQKNKTIVIKDGKITNIGLDGRLDLPQDVETKELPGKIVIPGLIDAHLHLLQSGVNDFEKPYAESLTKKFKRNSYLTLKSGVTTVRNMPGMSGYKTIKYRDKIKNGKILGPRMFTSGPALSPPNGYFSSKQYFPSNSIIRSIMERIFRVHGLSIDVENAKEVKKALTKLNNKGVDFIKTVTPGKHVPFADDDEVRKQIIEKELMDEETMEAEMKPEVLERIVELAHESGLKVAAHNVFWPEGFKKAVQTGLDSIEHSPVGIMDDETFDIMKEQNTYWVPTGYCFYNWSDLIDNPEHYNKPEMKELIPEPLYTLGEKSLQRVRENIEEGTSPNWGNFYKRMEPYKKEYFPKNFQQALKKDINIVAGTDCGVGGAGYMPHGKLYKELELYVDNGMDEFEAIQTATKNAAELLESEDKFGTIEEGKIADLVILNSNPLEKISNINDIKSVIKKGKVVVNEDN